MLFSVMGDLLSQPSDIFAFGGALGTTSDFTLNEDGNAEIKGYPVFRTGQFADSKGRVQKWTSEDLASMVTNFSDMREEFPNPVVREDHSRSMGSLVGYVDGLSLSDDKNTLLADFTLTKGDAIEKWQRKHYRGRSSEIGAWRVAEDDVRAPFYMGFAFVDIPAVTRLYSAADPEPNLYMEAKVPEEITKPEGGPAPELHKFTVAGAEVTDYAAVQAHIEALEVFQAEQREKGRTDFVDKMISENRIAAPAKDATVEFAKSLSDEQFASWSKVTEAAAPLAAFGSVETAGSDGTAAGERSALEGELADKEAVVAHFRRSGMETEKLEQLESYKRMVAIKQELSK